MITRHRLDEIRPIVASLEAMPTIPVIVQPLVSMLKLPPDEVDVEKVVELVSYDGTIAAHCLRMANSPLFGRRNSETVRGAVLALGLKRIEAILLGCCLSGIVPAQKWAFEATIFWRHSLGCALVSSKMAKLIGYPEPEKAYLAGLLHDLGILVNTVAFQEDFRQCVRLAQEGRMPLHRTEEQHLGLTHCQSGKILAEHWHFSEEVIEVIEFHHNVAASSKALVSLVHLSDLLCRLRDLGYGYYESMGVDLLGDVAWASLVEHYPALASMDLARLTMDIDGAMEEIVSVVDAVFESGPAPA